MYGVLNCGSRPRQLADILSKKSESVDENAYVQDIKERGIHGCQIETASKGSPAIGSAVLRSIEYMSPRFSEIVPV